MNSSIGDEPCAWTVIMLGKGEIGLMHGRMGMGATLDDVPAACVCRLAGIGLLGIKMDSIVLETVGALPWVVATC